MQSIQSFIKDSFLFLFLSFIAFLSFSVLGFFVYTHNETLLSYNRIIYNFFEHIATPQGIKIFMGITFLGSPLFMIFLLLLLILYNLYKKRFDESFVYFFGGIGAAEFVFLAKDFFGIARPTPYAVLEIGNAFPSGHTTLTFLVGFLICSFFIRDEKIHRRLLFLLTASLYSLLIAFSRLYLGVHWLTDIVGGFLLGCAFLSLSFVVDIFCTHFFKKD
jgi:undecaprenyl-diphosphatase